MKTRLRRVHHKDTKTPWAVRRPTCGSGQGGLRALPGLCASTGRQRSLLPRLNSLSVFVPFVSFVVRAENPLTTKGTKNTKKGGV